MFSHPDGGRTGAALENPIVGIGASALHIGSAIGVTAAEGDCAFLGGAKFDRDADTGPAVLGLKHTKVQMRAARKSRIARMGDDISGGHGLSYFHEDSPFF